MGALDDWLKRNKAGSAADAAKMVGAEIKGNAAGLFGKLFAASSLVGIAQANTGLGKIKATLKAIFDLTLGGRAFLASAYPMMRKAIQTLVHDTGSLEAALKKLQKVQGLQRVFAPFVGGLEMAKRKVAELLLLTQHGPFNLDQWGSATKTLLSFTRGMFSGQRQLIAIGDSAAKSKNDIESVADVVAEFYQALRGGQPIDNAVEKLREMGVISDGTAQSLIGLGASGADVTDMTRELTAALEENKGGMAGLKNDLAGVEDQFLKAKAALAEKFGEAFTEAEIENVKNYTAAMQAVAPAVGRLGDFFQKFFGVFGTAKSSFVRWIAESERARNVTEGVIKALTLLVSVVSAGATIWLGKLAVNFALASTMAGGFGLTLRALVGMTGIGAVLLAVGALAQGLINLSDSTEQAMDAASKEAKAHREAKAAIDARIASVRTLTDQQEALAAATDRLIELQEQQNKLRAEVEQERGENNPETPSAKGMWNQVKGFFGDLFGFGSSGSADAAARINAGEVAAAKRQVEKLRNVNVNSLTPGAAEQRRVDLERQRSLALEETRLHEKEVLAQDDPSGIMAERRGVIEKRAREAESGVNAAAAVERQRAELERELQILKLQGASPKKLLAAEAAKLDAGLKAPETSAVYAETKAAKIEHYRQSLNPTASIDEKERHAALAGNVTGTAADLSFWRNFAKQQREFEDQLPDLSSQAGELGADEKANRRSQMVERFGVRRHENILDAQRGGAANEVVSLSDLDMFAEKFEQLRTRFGDSEARSMAQRLTNLDIRRQTFDAERSGIVDSLQRIGGGGGVSMDPMLTAAQRQAELIQRSNDYLAAIVQALEGTGGSQEPQPDNF